MIQYVTVFNSWYELEAELRRRMEAHPTARRKKLHYVQLKGICHNGKSKDSLTFNDAPGTYNGEYFCRAGCHRTTILEAFGLPFYPKTDNDVSAWTPTPHPQQIKPTLPKQWKVKVKP